MNALIDDLKQYLLTFDYANYYRNYMYIMVDKHIINNNLSECFEDLKRNFYDIDDNIYDRTTDDIKLLIDKIYDNYYTIIKEGIQFYIISKITNNKLLDENLILNMEIIESFSELWDFIENYEEALEMDNEC